MARFHVGAQDDEVAVGFLGAQPRHPLGRLPISDARIGEPGQHEHGRIGLGRYVVVGRIGEDVPEGLGVLDRIAPFRPLRRRERQTVVEHGVEHVDERHFGNDAAEQIRPQVGDRPHQETARRAAMGDDFVRRDPAGFDQIIGGGDEVAEGVRFARKLAFAVPAPAFLSAAAHVRDGIDEAAVDQREPARAERVPSSARPLR